MQHPFTRLLATAALCTALCAALGTLPAMAQPRAPHDGQPPAPPPEAFTACQGQAEGAAVTITLPDGKTLEGTCRTITTASGTALAARPNGRPDGPPPPQR